MAQTAKIGALTDELIQSIVKFDPESNKYAYKQAKDLAAKGLKAHQYARTNQFDVQASLVGLDEKFRILNRDDLADALQKRLKELQQIPNKWIPEYLSLLLQLSDRPVENSQVEALELLKPPASLPPLTWAQICKEYPLSDEELWKDIDYAAESSEDDQSPKRRERTAKKEITPPTNADEDDTYHPESCVVPVKAEAISEIVNAQFWKAEGEEETGKVSITELQAIRETLFMLAGLQSSLYVIDRQMGSVRVNQKYNLNHVISKTTDHLLSRFAELGRDLFKLRQWTARSSSLSLVQAFEASVRTRLADFDRYLAVLQRKYLVPDAPIVVTMLELLNEVREKSVPLLRLAQLVADIEPLLLVNPFAHLETLFDRISLAQMTLEREVFDYLADIFFECLQTYLKPIRRWMEFGELGANDETFFVFENDSSTEASSLWHDRYVLRRGKENALRAPKFLQPAAQKIFNTGKSVVFLKELGIYGTGISHSEPEPRLDHETVCGINADIPLSPFSELFRAAFETWIRSKYSLASSVLRARLFSNCGLLSILNIFNRLYLAADGSVFQDFADAMFERMDSKRRGWNDRFLLTELAHGIFSTGLDAPDAEKIVVRNVLIKEHGQSVKALGSVAIDYALPWSIMNIVQRSSIPVYQQVFTFLLQVYRAKYLLQKMDWKSIPQSKYPNLTQTSYKLRQRLIWFADILRSYLTETVFAPATDDMTSAMIQAEDIDQMSDIHIKYIARLQEQSLLSRSIKLIQKAIISILDFSVLFADIHSSESRARRTPTQRLAPTPKSPAKYHPNHPKPRRKSFAPLIIDDGSSDSADGGDHSDADAESSTDEADFVENLKKIEEQFERLLSFVTAGLRSVSRASSEPVWEMLAERLEWNTSKDRY
ncbi:hypothetical protein K469DRAFT_644338 [Zopfia rhizophila CBS 207.26]|uniref:Spindle pole body component n=1 Tax=Zopfia rhizophila CBS 207.26 TaxID=1314779 RepID=A0A6A6DES1_9PEZI|nr:hypothetical protein K469DRAFT_644338 [Zopfia rhizophila CBS 207.26]